MNEVFFTRGDFYGECEVPSPKIGMHISLAIIVNLDMLELSYQCNGMMISITNKYQFESVAGLQIIVTWKSN